MSALLLCGAASTHFPPGVDNLWQLWYNIAVAKTLRRKGRKIMILSVVMAVLLGAVPFTGDTFPAKTLIIVALAAVVVLVLAFVLRKKDGGGDDKE